MKYKVSYLFKLKFIYIVASLVTPTKSNYFVATR